MLLQFKYNHWRENTGYVNEEANKDYRYEYFSDANLSRWCLDEKHLTYETKVLPSDKEYPKFEDYWHDKANNYADEARDEKDPLSALDDILADFYAKSFRGVGVDAYYKGKEQAIPDIAKEIRRIIEHDLFERWKVGDISITELQKVGRLLSEHITNTRKSLDERNTKLQEELEESKADRNANHDDFINKGFLSRKVFNGTTNSFAEHQDILTEVYTLKTSLVAIEFAKKLATRLVVEINKLDADIDAFGQIVNDAIAETQRLMAAQSKTNKGLEDIKGAVVEVSEEEVMFNFEVDLKIDKVDMPNIAGQLRNEILPKSDFTTFGNLANEISVDQISKAFDLKLSEIVKAKHDQRAVSDIKVLGLNILTQLQQKLVSDEQIKQFALDIVRQSGVFLKLNNDQMQLHVRNNEGNLSPTNSASINKKTILVNIPSPDDNESLKRFADKLESAFKASFAPGNSQCNLVVNRKSPKKNELSIITVAYCFPMRCISWLETYKEKYVKFLHTGNPNTDASNAILLHSENDGADLPSLFVVDNAEAIAAQTAMSQTASPAQPSPSASAIPAPPASMPPMPGMSPAPAAEPQVNMFFHIAGQNYGPYNYAIVK